MTYGSGMIESYPFWTYFPRSAPPPPWVSDLTTVVGAEKTHLDSRHLRMTSNEALKVLEPGLKTLGFSCEVTKARTDKIRRPVLFGSEGSELVAYEIDAFHDELGIVLEIEAGRGRHGGAFFRDLIRTSLIVGAEYLAIGMLIQYRYQSGGRGVSGDDYLWALAELDAVFASGRLKLPFRGVLLFGY